LEQRHVRSIEGSPEPADIFEPHMPGVELFSDMDALFEEARRFAATGEPPARAGEPPPAAAAALEKMKGKRSVVILTPGRLMLTVPTPEPENVTEEMRKGVSKLLPPDSPRIITAVSYTYHKALGENMSKAIPFLGFLVGFALIGHTVVVFEGHPSAFESGVRGSDVLLADSAMLPFMQADWKETAFRVMSPDAKVLVHDRPSYGLVQHFRPGAAQTPLVLSPEQQVEQYAGSLIRLLLVGTRTSVELISGERLPHLLEFATTDEQRAAIASLPLRYEELDADRVIDAILRAAGWGPFSIFKTTGTMKLQMKSTDGRPLGFGACGVKLSKLAGGRRRLLLER
jgi:hypothetical protein